MSLALSSGGGGVGTGGREPERIGAGGVRGGGEGRAGSGREMRKAFF